MVLYRYYWYQNYPSRGVRYRTSVTRKIESYLNENPEDTVGWTSATTTSDQNPTTCLASTKELIEAILVIAPYPIRESHNTHAHITTEHTKEQDADFPICGDTFDRLSFCVNDDETDVMSTDSMFLFLTLCFTFG
jgi:hypothetical protein